MPPTTPNTRTHTYRTHTYRTHTNTPLRDHSRFKRCLSRRVDCDVLRTHPNVLVCLSPITGAVELHSIERQHSRLREKPLNGNLGRHTDQFLVFPPCAWLEIIAGPLNAHFQRVLHVGFVVTVVNLGNEGYQAGSSADRVNR